MTGSIGKVRFSTINIHNKSNNVRATDHSFHYSKWTSAQNDKTQTTEKSFDREKACAFTHSSGRINKTSNKAFNADTKRSRL